ncbi:nuclear transport factor 2 family protein [Tamlana sp. 2201CG12-4]|uniref:nuclear transport factor 2 family protein n=1 Tax=Tamlana sp. 2201CG12-4 TaxID=3112582 RepID=UPI002DBDCB54|nr:nuclear transport factor 2 family protein [Tamlana sp. 2201CG12-4]MEC3905438.1 nuclear transport factor 2 family protein [Tamlana sp. 2201CG12-4]
MKKLSSPLTYLSISIALLISSCNTSKKTNTVSKTKENMEQKNLKSIAKNAQDAFFKDYNAEGIKIHFIENYIQHNPHVPTGRETVIGFLPTLKQAKTTSKTHRVLQDGDFIVMHNTYSNAEAFGAKEMVAFDVYRIENNKVAEHWDNLSPIAKKTASGRSQFDGSTEIVDKEKTETNKELVRNFVNDILMGKNPNKITEYISTEQYHQHNIAVEDGLDGLGKAIDYLVSQNDMFIYNTLHNILGEGNFVLTMSEGEWHKKPHAFYDLFRIENDKIVEHWDIINEIPEVMAHNNGKF